MTKTYFTIGLSFAAAVFVYLFWRRGEKLSKIQAELFREKANQEVKKYAEEADRAVNNYKSKRAEYDKLKRKFQQRARKAR